MVDLFQQGIICIDLCVTVYTVSGRDVGRDCGANSRAGNREVVTGGSSKFDFTARCRDCDARDLARQSRLKGTGAVNIGREGNRSRVTITDCEDQREAGVGRSGVVGWNDGRRGRSRSNSCLQSLVGGGLGILVTLQGHAGELESGYSDILKINA